MRTLQFLVIVAVFFAAYSFASETSDNFAKWAPDFAAGDLNVRKDAQQNWQTFCKQKGNQPEVQKEIIRVSVEQLAKDNPTETALWIIRQLGFVGDATAVPALTKYLTDQFTLIRSEAARALANIPGKEAEAALKKADTSESKDALISRNIKVSIPKNNPAETSFPQAIPYIPSPGNEKIVTWLKNYGQLSDMEKSQVLGSIAVKALNAQVRKEEGGDSMNRIAIPFALEAAKSSDETLRNAGLVAVGALGGIPEVPFLLEQAQTGGNTELAKVVLSRMNQQGIEALLVEKLKAEKDNGKFVVLADVLSRRFNAEMRPILLERAQAADTGNRQELLQLAEPLSTKSDIADYVKTWTLITDRQQKDETEKIIARLCEGDADSVLKTMGNWSTPDGLRLLGRIGDPKTIEQIRKSKTAITALREWPDAKVADDLFAVAGNAKASDEDRLAALRAFIRIISLPNDRIGIQINDSEKVQRLIDVYPLAKRSEEKRYIIERVGQIRTKESLPFILQHFDDPELQERVCQSILDLAHHVEFKRQSAEAFDAALDKVLAVTKRTDLSDRAKRYKAQK